MFISKKKLQKEVERRAREIYRTEVSRKTMLDQERKIRRLHREIRELRQAVAAIKPVGRIKGYYQGDDGKVIICEGVDTDKKSGTGRESSNR